MPIGYKWTCESGLLMWTYNLQGLSYHKHQITVGDHLGALDQIAGDHNQKHGMCLEKKLG